MWQRRAATVLGVLAVLAVTTGMAVLRSVPSGSGSETSASSGVTVEAPEERTSEASRQPRPTSPRPGPQPANSVRLPDGATATLVRTELTADGTLPIPDGVAHAAWWGAEFGHDRGVALVAGHVDWYGRSGSFSGLFRLVAGDEVVVRDEVGRRWTYRVVAATTVHKSGLAPKAPELFSQDGPHRLVLVTCGGDYVGGAEGYEDNHIVTAELVSGP